LKLLYSTILFIFITCSQETIADEITLAADSWCPINCEPNSDKPDFMVEITRYIFAQQGHTIKYLKIPWLRAIKLAEKGKINGVIGAYKGDSKQLIFPQHEQALLNNACYVLKDNPWNYTDTSSLENHTLGIVRGYDYGDEINQYIKRAKKSNLIVITGTENLTERLLTLLERKRADIVLETDIVYQHIAKKLGVTSMFRFAGESALPSKSYVAFSPMLSTSKNYAEILSDGMVEIRKSGKLAQIMEKYGL